MDARGKWVTPGETRRGREEEVEEFGVGRAFLRALYTIAREGERGSCSLENGRF